MSGTQIQCEEDSCTYQMNDGRCIAEHVSMVIEQGDMFCDTYEDQTLWFDDGDIKEIMDWDDQG